MKLRDMTKVEDSRRVDLFGTALGILAAVQGEAEDRAGTRTKDTFALYMELKSVAEILSATALLQVHQANQQAEIISLLEQQQRTLGVISQRVRRT